MKQFRILFVFVLISIVSSSIILCLSTEQEIRDIYNSIKGENAYKTVSDLCAPEMEGRNSGDAGFDRAAEYIIKNLKELNLKPLYDNYLQKYTLPVTDVTISEASVSFGRGAERIPKKLELFVDYLPDMNSGFGKIKGKVVFAGYGITAPDNNWDDYRGIDVKGKIVIVLSGPPIVAGKDFSKYWGASDHKFRNAVGRGAVAFIRVTSLIGVRANRYIEDFPMLRISRDRAEELLAADGISIKEPDKTNHLGEGLTYETTAEMEIEIRGKHCEAGETANVVALLEGSDPKLKDEYILLGAHLDHVGKMFKVFPGANDNASGCAVILELARAFSKLENRPKRSLVFAFFGSEETARLGGSKHVAENPPYADRQPEYMFNYDVVATGVKLLVSGGDLDDPVIKTLIDIEKHNSIGLEIVSVGNSPFYKQSDHAAFDGKGAKAYGNSSDDSEWDFMHTEDDNLNAVNSETMEKFIKIYFLLLDKLLNE